MVSYTRASPLLCSIKERFLLNRPGSGKQTYHVVIDLGEAEFSYQIGDSVGVLPRNQRSVVDRTLQSLGVSGQEVVTDSREGRLLPFKEHLEKNFDLARVSTALLQLLFERHPSGEKKAYLEFLLDPAHREELKQYASSRQVWDCLEEYRAAAIDPAELIDRCFPLLPRLYSIASSQNVVGNEVHLTVGRVFFSTNGHERSGVCSDYLCETVERGAEVVPIYLQPSKTFRLAPAADTDVIMVGPGTGIAPFRALMQERESVAAEGKNWLFFGDWNRAFDYYYEEYWESLQQKGMLRCDLAFSRDQAEKIYVQHKMLEHGNEIWQWLERGAHLYVCGDASRMAKDVEATLHRIIQTHGDRDEKSARDYVKQLRKFGRYLRDVY